MPASLSTQLLHDIRCAIGAALPDRFQRRRGVMPPAVAFIGLLSMTALGMRSGYEPLLASLCTSLAKAWGWSRQPAASTFCRARRKIDAAMFAKVWAAVHRVTHLAVAPFMPTVRGYRLVAIDGARISVANSRVLRKALGVHRMGPDRCSMRHPQMLVVVLTDALTRAPIARIDLPNHGSERDGAKALMKHLLPTDLLLADRGFPSRELLAMIRATKCRFIMRVSSGQRGWRDFRAVQKRRIRDTTVTIQHPECPFTLRHVRISGGPGRPRKNSKRDTQFLLTNLPAAWSVKCVGSLYAARWGVETLFRELKVTLERKTGMTSRTLGGVIQELDARSLHLAIAAFLEIAAMVEAKNLAKRSRFTVNRTALLALVALLVMLPNDDAERERRMGDAAVTIARRAQKKRPGRHAPREEKKFANSGKSRGN